VIYISSNSFTHMHLKDVLNLIEPHFRGFEISAEGTLRLPDIENDLKEYMESYDMRFQVHAPYSDINIAAGNPSIRKAVLNELIGAMRSAHSLGIYVVTIHPGFRTPLYRRAEDVRKRTIETLKILEKHAIDLGIALALENMPLTFITVGREPWELEEMTDGLEIRWCFDVGHANTTGTIDKFIEHRERFANIHIHDNMGKEDEHLPLGDGNIPWKQIFSSLSGYRGNFVLEMDRGMDDALKSMDFLRNNGIKV